MGCIKTKEAGPDKQTENGGGEGGFQPMRQKKNITKAESIIVSQADFVLSWKDVSMFTQNYTLDRNVIGEGAFGAVHKCLHKSTKETRAVKIIEKDKMEEQEKVRLQYEVEVLKNLNHPNIVRLFEVYESKDNIFLVTELCDGRELFDEIT